MEIGMFSENFALFLHIKIYYLEKRLISVNCACYNTKRDMNDQIQTLGE